jgi:mono/diheme cytochrome c family protein
MMKNARRWLALLVLLSGCDLPGKPKPANKFEQPAKIKDFPKLYAKNCAGCHGKDGKLGPAPPLNDAVFLAIAPDPAEKGDVGRGQAVFTRVCADCHGQDGKTDAPKGAVNDPAFLTLASEQVLRRFVITGRADLGMPNCAEHDGGALTAAEVSELVALLMSWKQNGTAKK